MKKLQIPALTPHAAGATNPKPAWARRGPHRQAALLAVAAQLASTPAQAVDGCQVLLCLAAPSWRAIPQCVPPVTQLFRDLARGRPFPGCAMAGAGSAAGHSWSSAPHHCPPQYSRVYDGPNGPVHACDFDGAISITVQGDLFATTWWSTGGDSVTDFSPGAKARLGVWDTRFDDEFAAWLARRPSEPVPQH
jgi:hypothetical protein